MHPNTDSPSAPPIPSELAGRLPRITRLSSSGAQMVRLAAISLALAIGVGLYAAVDAVEQIEHRAALRRDGKQVVGTVTALRKSGLFYTFTVNGVSYGGKTYLPEHIHLSLGQLANYMENSPIPIRYLPQNPAINHPAAWEWPSFMDLGWFLFPIFFGPFGYFLVTDLRRDRQLVSEGVAATGTVKKCTRLRKGGFAIDYEFPTEDGSLVQGSGASPAEVEIGAGILLLYLPQNPQRSNPYPAGSYRVAQ
jgi:hypothetical protein